MEWLILLPLLFALPLAAKLWQRRRIPSGATVEITFDMSMPSKWAAELMQRALNNEGTRSRLRREEQLWLCSVVKPMSYHQEAVEKLKQHLDQLAAARGGQCLRYQVTLGKRSEVHLCQGSGHCV